jgi:hypothetical protein
MKVTLAPLTALQEEDPQRLPSLLFDAAEFENNLSDLLQFPVDFLLPYLPTNQVISPDFSFANAPIQDWQVRRSCVVLPSVTNATVFQKNQRESAPPKFARIPPATFVPRHQRSSASHFFEDDSNETQQFVQLCFDQTFRINPSALQFIPASYWPNKDFTFGEIVFDHFRRKNNPSSRFSHKLYNALKLREQYQTLAPFIGVEWLTDTILLVNRVRFARLLGIGSVSGSLFQQQGNFSTHGFTELSLHNVRSSYQHLLQPGLDDAVTHFLTHSKGRFKRNSTEEDAKQCLWQNPTTKANS